MSCCHSDTSVNSRRTYHVIYAGTTLSTIYTLFDWFQKVPCWALCCLYFMWLILRKLLTNTVLHFTHLPTIHSCICTAFMQMSALQIFSCRCASPTSVSGCLRIDSNSTLTRQSYFGLHQDIAYTSSRARVQLYSIISCLSFTICFAIRTLSF